MNAMAPFLQIKFVKKIRTNVLFFCTFGRDSVIIIDGREDYTLEKYKTLIEINRKIVFGEKISDEEKKDAVSVLLNGVCDKEEVSKYKRRKRRMKVKAETDSIYPNYYIPPYNGNQYALC